MRITIRTRILSIFIGVALIQALLLGAFFLYQNNKSRHSLVIQQLQAVSENLNAQISIFLNTILHDLETASQQVERMAQKDYQQYNLLKTLKNNNPAFSTLAFYDINGIIKSAVSSDENQRIPDCFTKNSDLFDVPYYSGIPYVAQLTLDNDALAIGISQPVHFLDKSYIIGVISALVPYENLQQIIDKAILPSALDVLVLNSEGKVLAQTSNKETAFSSFPAKQKWDGDLVINHVRYISVSSHLEFYGQKLTMVAKIDSTKSLAQNSYSFLLLFFLIILLLLSALVGWTTNKKIIEPLQLLANDSTTILQGKEIDISAHTDAELHDLANAMNAMNQQLLKSNISLEKEVERRRSEEKTAILAKIEAEKANQAKSIFLANMSHEIRTPLHGMIGMLEMIGKNYLNEEQKQLLSMATLSGQRLQTVVSSILDISQIESGKFQLPHSPFSLSGLITEVVELMQIQAENKDIRISSHLTADIPDALIGDSGRIRQILINLINNSIKFSEHGTIELEIKLQSRATEDKVELLFCVKDQGKGVSEAAQHAIFDAFDRGDTEKDNIVGGTGLGLTISSEFAQHMHGKLWLASSDTSGSTFCFTILCDVIVEKIPQGSDQIGEETKQKRLAGIRIFLAEDEFINQRIISAYLEEQGGSVIVCADGQELLDSMRKETADIILMDIRMPVLNGLETTRIIREREKDSPHPPIPIVALTAQATTDFEKKCKKAGMNDYLTKPIPFEELVRIICDLAGK